MAITSTRILGLLLALPLLMSACAEEGDWRAHQRLVVERRPTSILLPMDDDSVVKPEDMPRLQNYVDVFLNRGEAPVTLSVLAGEGDEAKELARQRTERMVELLTAMGIDRATILVRNEKAKDEAGQGLARLGYDVYAVRVPQCGDWSDNSSFTALRNEPSPSFGCAVSRNIGLMVDNPRDLIKPRALEGRDAARGATIIGKYRAGEDTVSKGNVTTSISSTGQSN